MVINELLRLGLDKLKGREFANPALEARLILAKLLKVDKSYIYAYGEKEVSKEVEEKFVEFMEKRADGYPLQYLINEKEFMGLDFYVEEGVLVPRPDTEVLVEYILNYIDREFKDENIKVLDLGIGSGAISLSIANYCPKAFVYGVDIDEIPIKVSNINKEKFKLNNVEFLKGDLFQPIEDLNMKNSFNIIASNPPYIPKKEIEKLQIEVKTYEPRLALDGGDEGLDFYRQISVFAKDYLVHSGLLIYEIGYDQGIAVKEIMCNEGYKNIEILQDLQGLDRVVLGYVK